MLEKGMILPPVPSQLVLLRPNPLLQWRLGALTALVFFLMLVVCNFSHLNPHFLGFCFLLSDLQMPEKGMILPPVPSQLVLLRPNPLLQWRLGALTALVFFLMLVVWSIDGCSIQSFVEPWRFNAYSVRISPFPSPLMSPKPKLQKPTKSSSFFSRRRRHRRSFFFSRRISLANFRHYLFRCQIQF
ncbi:unnamed protein product [Arabidopsis lyrata]|nr:unnamed protein product [Arabidopsis lyrata]